LITKLYRLFVVFQRCGKFSSSQRGCSFSREWGFYWILKYGNQTARSTFDFIQIIPSSTNTYFEQYLLLEIFKSLTKQSTQETTPGKKLQLPSENLVKFLKNFNYRLKKQRI